MKNLGLILALCGILAVSNLVAAPQKSAQKATQKTVEKTAKTAQAKTAQESNGVFLGFELSVGGRTQKITTSGGGNSSIVKGRSDGDGYYGGKIGYKHFFNDWLGIRGYFGMSYASYDSNQSYEEINNNQKAYGLTYTINADALFNFYNDESVSYGAFAGLGLGGLSSEYGIFGKDTTFYADIKLGLRAQVGHSGFDFTLIVPFAELKYKMNLDYGYTSEVKNRRDYALAFAYSFTF